MSEFRIDGIAIDTRSIFPPNVTLEQKLMMIEHCKARMRQLDCMHWLLNRDAVVAEAAHAVLDHDTAAKLSWMEPALMNIWMFAKEGL